MVDMQGWLKLYADFHPWDFATPSSPSIFKGQMCELYGTQVTDSSGNRNKMSICKEWEVEGVGYGRQKVILEHDKNFLYLAEYDITGWATMLNM